MWASVRDSLSYMLTQGTEHEWANALKYFAAGLLVAAASGWVIRVCFRHLLRAFGEDVTKKLTRAFIGPVALFWVAYFSLIGFDCFKGMPGAIWMHVHSNVYPMINALIVFILAYRSVDIVSKVLHLRWVSHSKLDERWADIMGAVGKTIVIAAGILMALGSMGVNILPLLTGAGFFGAALALASQNTIANAIGSLEIMIDRLFKEGDRISFGDYDGFVTRMGLRSVELTALTGEKINLPNKDLVDKQIRNYSRDKLVRTTITVSVPYNSSRADVQRALATLDAAVSASPRARNVQTAFSRFTDSALELQAIFWADYKTYTQYNELISELHLNVKEAFDKEKLEFAFPTTTVYLQNVSA